MGFTNLVPKRRFKEFQNNHAWEQRKLGEVTKSYSGGTPSVGNPEYYNGNIPFIRSAEINSNSTDLFITESGLNNSSAKMVEVGDILYALYGATSGEVGISRISGAINQAILAIQPEEGYDSQFIMQWLRGQKQKIIDKYLQGGQGNLSGSIVNDFQVEFPNNEEQKTIGQFFQNLDNLITLHQRMLEKTKALKSAYLSEMFPAEGDSEPKRRFAGFTQTWEPHKLGDLVSIKSGWSPTYFVKSYDQNSSLFIKVDDLNYSSREQIESHVKVQANPRFIKMKKGSTIFPKRGAAIMTNKVRILCSDGYMDTNMMALEPESIDGDFLYTFIQRTGLYKIADTSTIPQINNKHIEPYIIYLPRRDEQKKIGEFFKHFDSTITLHQRKLEKLQNIKKAYLNEMFI